MHRPNCTAQYKIDLYFDFDMASTYQQSGFTSGSWWYMYLEASLFQSLACLQNGVINTSQRLLARHCMINECKIKIDRQARHIAYKKIDRCAAL